ncbi:RrF2 family transcriptional regulator [Emticicia sp. SJ17W-69]|uniref:RrF2 family transcriptional regulator n=1 Tax=Emticicia sp. SJ17W-69 TaxID=3421657 RepID=UPI003EBD3745
MNNARFQISVHILTLLAKADGEPMSSELIAGSININPVLVRKEISVLRKAGMVQSKEGKNGGCFLAKNAQNILLSDVYQVVRQDASVLGKSKNMPNPACLVGRQINHHIEGIYQIADDAILESLGKISLAEFTNKFE